MSDLADDQHRAAKAVLLSRRALDVIVGPAGSGKTTTLAALADAWRQVRGDVIGLAPSASAAATLSESARWALRDRRQVDLRVHRRRRGPTGAPLPGGDRRGGRPGGELLGQERRQ